MSDKDLDNIFKEGLSARNVEFNMESWRKMEQMLPPEPTKGRFMIYRAAAIIGAILLLSISLFVWNTNDGDRAITENNTNSAAASELTSEKNDTEINSSKEDALADANGETESELNSESEGSFANEEENSSSTEVQVTGSTSILSNSTQMAFNSGNGIGNNNLGVQQAFEGQNTGNRNAFLNGQSNQRVHENGVTIPTSPFTKISGLDELQLLALQSDEEEVIVTNVADGKLPKPKRNLFGFIGGVNLQNSLADHSSSSSIVVSEFAGVTYEHFMNGGFSLKANLLYSAMGDVGASKLHDEKVYDFGSSTEQTLVECQRLINLELPVMANYNIGNHNIFAGASLSYLLSGYNKVTTNYTDISDSWSEEKYEWGYTNGFRTFDFALVAGYEYSISPSVNIGTRLNYGLVDLTDNNYFQSNSFDNNVQLRLYLKFTPFQF